MTVKISKPALNLREELNKLDKPSGITGETLLRADTDADARATLGIDNFEQVSVSTDGVISADGLDVTGTATMDGLTVGDNSTSEIPIYFNSSSIDFSIGANGNNFILAQTTGDLDSNQLLTVTSTGNVGIGTSSPDAKLTTQRSGSAQGVSGGYSLKGQDGTTQGGIGTDGVNDNYLQILAAQGVKFHTSNIDGTTNERMRIDSSGNLLVGTTSTAVSSSTGSVTGSVINNTGLFEAAKTGTVMELNRLSSDGTILNFRKDGTTVGSIGVSGGNNLFISGQATNHAGLTFATQSVLPTTEGVINNDTVDLGQNGNAFKDLWLSGGVYLGGTGSANKLDDYEEGTWTPLVIGSGSSGTYTGIARSGTYVKIGSLVHISGFFYGENGSGSGNLQLSGLPFSQISDQQIIGEMQINSGLSGDAVGKNLSFMSGSGTKLHTRAYKGDAYYDVGYPSTCNYLRFNLSYRTDS